MQNIVGTPRQVKYALDVIKQIQQKYPKHKLPDVSSATYWINFQSEHPDRLWELSREIQTAFTDVYPKYHRDIAVDALHQIVKHLDDVVIADTETTGIKKTDVIVEIGLVKFIRRKPVIVYETLIKPENMDLSRYDKSKASEINCITPDMLKNSPTLPEVWSFIKPYLHQHVICFNSWFDVNAIIRSAKHYPELLIPDIHSTDIMKIAQVYYEMPDALSLDELTQRLHMRIPKHERHRAASDALITGRALLKMYKLSRLEQ